MAVGCVGEALGDGLAVVGTAVDGSGLDYAAGNGHAGGVEVVIYCTIWRQCIICGGVRWVLVSEALGDTIEGVGAYGGG